MFNTSIGKFCSIADNCYFGGAQHPMYHVSTSSVFHKGRNIMGVNFADHEHSHNEKIEIWNVVWIGASVLIKGGVKIDYGAIVAMGAVVTKDVPPYSDVAGVPAIVIKSRFSAVSLKNLREFNGGTGM